MNELKSNKWRYAFIILLIIYAIIHILVAILFLDTLHTFLSTNSSNNAASIGPGLFLMAIAQDILLPLGIIDIILMLLYSVSRFLTGKPKTIGYGIWVIVSLVILRFTYDYFVNAVRVWFGLW